MLLTINDTYDGSGVRAPIEDMQIADIYILELEEEG